MLYSRIRAQKKARLEELQGRKDLSKREALERDNLSAYIGVDLDAPEKSDEPVEYTESSLMDMLKDDLQDVAEGMELETTGTKAEITARILEAQAAKDEGEITSLIRWS